MPLSNSLSTKKRVLFSCIATGISLIVIELFSLICLTFFFISGSPWPSDIHVSQDQDLGWAITPYVTNHVVNHTKGFDVTYRTNEHFRVDVQQIPSAAQADVVLIGDSHIFGFGLTDKQTLAAQLHKALSGPERQVSVLNAGVPGYGPVQYYLRLQSLGPLRQGAFVIVYVNPINDIVNLSADIEYQYTKPHATLRNGKLVFSDPVLYDPVVLTHFEPQYGAINRAFNISEPATVPLIARLSRRSPTTRLLRAFKEGTIRFRWSGPLKGKLESGSKDGRDLELAIRDPIRNNPNHAMSWCWPAISEFRAERAIAGETLRSLFSAMRQHCERQKARLLVVVAQEAHRNQPFRIRLTDFLMEQFPDYSFEWTLARDLVLKSAEEAGVSTLSIEYPDERIDQMFIPYDTHTSGEGFAVVADQVVTWMKEQKTH